MSRNLRLTVLCLALGILAACANTQLVNVWTDPSLKATKFTNILALVISRDEVARRIGEDTLVQALAPTRSICAYRILSDAELRDKNRANQALKAIGVDGVITMRLVDAQQQTTVVPGAYPGFWGYYGWAYPMAYAPGYLVTNTIVRVETKVYALDSDKLVWGGVSDTFNPASARDLVDDVARTVAAELKKQGLVQ